MAVDADASAEELNELACDEPDTEGAHADDIDVGHAENDADVVDNIGARTDLRPALMAGLAIVVALAGLAGWLGYRGYQSSPSPAAARAIRSGRPARRTESDHDRLHRGRRRRAAHPGLFDRTFRDDFGKRSAPFIEVVKQAQSKSEGTITEAGLESMDGNQAQVLVAVDVNTSIGGAGTQQPRAWRMRITVQKVGDGAKVSNVEFVP